jgi:uncharacterized protein YutE (UPF0331/DUF86 family)
MDERIKEHLKILKRYYLLLLDAQKYEKTHFLDNPIICASTERFLHLAIESCLNIGNRMLSLYQFQFPVEMPQTYSDIFVEMKKIGIIDEKFCESLIMMSKFRNRLVHLYWKIDNETTYKILHESIEDFKIYEKAIVNFLNNNPLKHTD